MLNWMIGRELILSSAPLMVRDDGKERNKLGRQGKRYGLAYYIEVVFSF
jgi:hypothetical protein